MKDLSDISFEASKQIVEESQNITNLLKTENTQTAWRLFSKAKNALEDGHRLENLSWRLFHMKMQKDSESHDDLSQSNNLSQSNDTTQSNELESNERDNQVVVEGHGLKTEFKGRNMI